MPHSHAEPLLHSHFIAERNERFHWLHSHFLLSTTQTVPFSCRKNDQQTLTALSQELYLKFDMPYPANVFIFQLVALLYSFRESKTLLSGLFLLCGNKSFYSYDTGNPYTVFSDYDSYKIIGIKQSFSGR